MKNKMMNIVILDGFSVNPGDLSWNEISSMGSCQIYDRTQPHEIIERAAGADAVLTNKARMNRQVIEALPQLKYIGVLATGYNTIDTGAAAEKGIAVTNIPAYSTNSVVQSVFAHLLNIANQVGHYTHEVKAGKWEQSPDFTFWDTPLLEISGKTLGIFGLGNIGIAVANVARSFGMNVIALTSKKQQDLPPGVQSVSKEELFRQSDVLTLHSPLTSETSDFVNARTLSLMKPSAILINTARGPLVNESDLAEALNNGRIYAAGVDVLSKEPPQKDNPLLSAKNCFITPHIAWATLEARTRLVKIAADNLKAFQEGKILNRIV